ncbi:FAD:protein FMN transferase [Roseobacter sp.]|uniref:FAD:protein FMN transferase n=1 Tax=Roseobacter sp. TaxID=1907202 RepID=UPI003297F501
MTISAACAAAPGLAYAQNWRGHAFGADISLTLHGPQDQAADAVEQARALIIQMERLFSLYDPTSTLVGLNTTGVLHAPPAAFLSLMGACDVAFGQTGGLFDPTVQPVWAALASGRDPARARDDIGWHRVRFDTRKVALGAGQALTFNGIAQGFATDMVTNMLTTLGFTQALVNIGEFRGIGGPWTLGLDDPIHGRLGTRQLHNGAIATSSPAATQVGGHGHILHAHATPQWSSVSVEAPSATVADALSTALVLADRDQIAEIKDRTPTQRVILVDFDGNLSTL